MIRHRLVRAPIVNRENFLVDAARGSIVLHLGCADAPLYREGGDMSLHARLAAVAKEIVGIDNDEGGVKFLREEMGFANILLGSVEDLPNLGITHKFNLIVAGEILEHLPNPGLCLTGMRNLLTEDGHIIVTVPNAFSVKSFLRVMLGCELIHPDHVSYFSITTMQKLLNKCGFTMDSHAYFWWGSASRIKRTADRLILGGVRRYAPYLCEGLIVVAHQSTMNNVRSLTE